jgi:hypothetical protein
MRLLKHPWLLVAIGLVLAIVASVGSIHWLLVDVAGMRKEYAELLLDVFKEVGLAFFIAGIAILSIEQGRIKKFADELKTEVDKELGNIQVATKELATEVSKELRDIKSATTGLTHEVDNKLKEIEKATTDLVYRGPLPREYYKKIKQEMLEPRFVRQEWIFRLEVSWIDDLDPDHEFLEFSFNQEYELRNVDSSTQKYTVSHFESCDWDWDPRFTNTTRIRYLRIYLGGVLIKNEIAPPGATLGHKDAEKEFMKVEHEVEVASGNVLRVVEGSSKVMSARHLETRMVSEPTMDLRLYLRYPEDLKVEIDLPDVLIGGENLELVSDEPLRDGKRESYWHVSRPVAPLTFFNIVWRKAQPAASGSGHAPAALAPATPAPAASAPADAPAAPAPEVSGTAPAASSLPSAGHVTVLEKPPDLKP